TADTGPAAWRNGACRCHCRRTAAWHGAACCCESAAAPAPRLLRARPAAVSGENSQPRLQCLADPGLHLLKWQSCIDHGAALWLARGYLQVGCAHALEEAELLLLEAVKVAAGAGALQAGLWWQVQ